MKRIAFAFLLAFCVALSCGAQAAGNDPSMVTGDSGEGYAVPTFKDLSQLLVMMGGVNIKENKVADDYAKLMFCGLYKDKFRNDFEWNKVRQEIINRVLSKKDYYRQNYELFGSFDLDRYNFDAQDFPLTSKTAMTRVGSMVLFDTTPDPKVRILCRDSSFSRVFPPMFLLVFEQPLTFDRLKLSVDEAKSLLERMNATRNRERRLYVRFRIHITGIDKVISTRVDNTQVNLKGDITDIDVFYDQQMTKWLMRINLNH